MKARLLAILAFGATMLALDAGGTAFSQGGGNSGPGSAVPNGPRIQRSQTCIVDDPTGTPLNVRERPHGSIVGALRNGTPVAAFNSVSDKDDDSGFTWRRSRRASVAGCSGIIWIAAVRCGESVD